MGRRPDYLGGSSIEYIHKGKHYDCRYRCEDGDCMNRESQWYGEICKIVGNLCKDYISLYETSKKAPISRKSNISSKEFTPKKEKTVQKSTINSKDFIPKKGNKVQKGDLVIFHSINRDIDVEYYMDENDTDISLLVEWAIGQSIGAVIFYDGNKFEIKSIKCKN